MNVMSGSINKDTFLSNKFSVVPISKDTISLINAVSGPNSKDTSLPFLDLQFSSYLIYVTYSCLFT